MTPSSFPNRRFSISGLAIRRHIGTLMLTLTVLVMGFFVTTQLPVDLLPSITYPRIGLRADAPGLAPEVAVDEITRPLEEALSATEGVVQVYSQTREGRISIDLFFEPGGDIDQALNDATATLNRARSNLPDSLDTPRLFKFDPSQLPVYEMALTSDRLSASELRIFAEEELERELQQVPGVASTDVSGGVNEEIQVNLDLQRLQAVGLTLPNVLDALRDRNQDVSGGRIRGGSEETLTRLVGRFQSADELRNLAIPVPGSDTPQRVLLRDLAEILDGDEEQRIFVTLNGQPAVKVSIQKQPTANTIEVVEGVKAKLVEMEQAGLMPEGLDMTATLDESRFIQNSIQNVAIAGLTGASLAAIAVMLFLGSLRQTFIIVVAIPLATLMALVLMGLFGLSLNVFSLGGLALGVGIVVDNSIVMLENMARRAEEMEGSRGSERHRHNLREAIFQAEASSQELESALLASTATNLVAVIPFLLIGGFISLIFNELILTISFAIAASLAVALTVVPTLASRLIMGRSTRSLQGWGPFRWFNNRLEGVTLGYGRLLTQVLRRRLMIIAAALLLFGGGSYWMVGQIPQEILPRISTGQARVFARFPAGTTVPENRRAMQAIDQILIEQPETTYVFSTAGGALFGTSTNENALRGTSTITLRPGSDTSAFVDRMNEELGRLPLVGTMLRVSPDSVRGLVLSNSPVRSDLDIGLQGEDGQALAQAGQQLVAALREANLARYRPDGEEPQEEIRILPDWTRATDLGLSSVDIGNTIQTALNGSTPTQLQRGSRLVDVKVQLAPGSVQRPSQLLDIPLFVNGGQLIQLGDVARVGRGPAPGEIQRINRRQVFLVAGDLADGASLGDALDEANDIIAGLELPAGITVLPSSAAETNRELQQSLVTLGALAAFLVFVVMAVQYNSLIDPLVIMLTVPLALAGGILGLFITQTAIGATVVVGAVLLVGIVVNNAIIMVELANQIYAASGCTRQEAILRAAPRRLRPILMTTFTTVLGLFPLALGIGEGAEFLQPLGIVVFSGLSLATVLTLFIIPCFYTLLHSTLGKGGKPRQPVQPYPETLDAPEVMQP